MSRGDERFDLIFADPPYTFDAYDSIIEGSSRLLAPGGLLVVEHDAELSLVGLATLPGPTRTRRYGETALSFFESDPESDLDPVSESSSD